MKQYFCAECKCEIVGRKKSQLKFCNKKCYTENKKQKNVVFNRMIQSIKNRLIGGRKKELNIDSGYLREIWENQNGFCQVTGIQLSLPETGRVLDKTRSPWKPSVDRIDPTKGYIKGNVRFVAYIANIAQSNFTHEELLQFCQLVIDNEKRKKGETWQT